LEVCLSRLQKKLSRDKTDVYRAAIIPKKKKVPRQFAGK